MSDVWNKDKKKGAPSCGIFLSIRASDFGLGDEKKAQDMTRRMREAIQGINASPYEKNFAVLEFVPDMGERDSEVIAEGVKAFVQRGGLIFMIRDSLTIAAKVGADGIFFSDASKAIEARDVVGDDPIIGACVTANMGNIEALDIVRTAENFTIEQILKLKAQQPDLMAIPFSNEITNDNCAAYVLAGCDFLDVTDYVWQHPESAVKAVVNMLYAIELAIEASAIKH